MNKLLDKHGVEVEIGSFFFFTGYMHDTGIPALWQLQENLSEHGLIEAKLWMSEEKTGDTFCRVIAIDLTRCKEQGFELVLIPSTIVDLGMRAIIASVELGGFTWDPAAKEALLQREQEILK